MQFIGYLTLLEDVADDIQRLTTELSSVEQQLQSRTKSLMVRKELLTKQLALKRKQQQIENTSKQKQPGQQGPATAPEAATDPTTA